MSEIKRQSGIATLANHYEEHGFPLDAHVSPIFQTSSFGFDNMAQAAEIFSGVDKEHYVYTRGRNPNAIALAKKIAILEGLDLVRAKPDQAVDQLVGGHCSASGMGAISALIFSLLKSGDHVITHTSLYSGTHKLLTEVCAKLGITVSVLESTDLADWSEELERHGNTKLLYVETPSNPRIELYDLEQLAGLAGQNGAWIAVDNTAATPFHQRPLSLGCDFVIHSTTKFLNGHSSALGGAVVGRHPEFLDFWGGLGQTAMELGATPSPSDCWLTNLGLKTFSLRMERHASNAMIIAEYLSKHGKVRRVLYPGLADNEYHQLAKKQMLNGFGSFLSFEIEGGEKEAHQFIDALVIPTIAISFGSTDSVVQIPAKMTHSGVSKSDLAKAKIGPNLVRFCVGIEDIDDLLEDLDQAFAKI
ncbi:MAG: PLP-dependent aspartate aminotransferase family protein [Pseudomonadota bacterium]